MEDQRISFETAKLAKEKGFVDFSKFPDNIPNHITQSLLQKWLREKHNIIIYVLPEYDKPKMYYRACILVTNIEICKRNNFRFEYYTNDFGTSENHEESLEIGLQEALKLIP